MVTGATITTPPVSAGTGNDMDIGMETSGSTAAVPNCTVNGTPLAGCTGAMVINGQICSFAFANNTMTVTCPVPQADNGKKKDLKNLQPSPA